MTWARTHLLKAWWSVASFQLNDCLPYSKSRFMSVQRRAESKPNQLKILQLHDLLSWMQATKGFAQEAKKNWMKDSLSWVRVEWKTAQGNGLRKPHQPPGEERRGARAYRERPANTSQLPVDSENVHDVEEQNHNQVAHGDNLKEAVCTVICPWRIIYADESNQQRDLEDKRHIQGVHFAARRVVEMILSTTKWHLETKDKYLM